MENFSPIYAQFRTLFEDHYKRIDRQVITQQENSQLSQLIKQFLTVLATDFLNENAQKILEYLLKNFEVTYYYYYFFYLGSYI
jgi:hypothetical protein